MRVFVLKPDAIGDFILATGCLRLLAREVGGENLILAVRTDVAPLAVSKFPKSTILPLTLRTKRRILNITTVNVLHNLPVWLRLLATGVDASICLRSMRAYLHTITFYLPRAKRRIACENLLLANPRVRRPAVENLAARTFQPTLLPYPSPGALPSDIEANRIVLESLIGRPIMQEDALPVLETPRPRSPKNNWLLAPFSSSKAKDYTASMWAEAILATLPASTPLVLAAAPNQYERLKEFARALAKAGIDQIELLTPQPLDDYVQTIAEASLVLTVDTATAHMACATGTRAVIVSAGQHAGVYAPYSKNGAQHWILPPVGHPPKEWHSAISPRLVAERISEALRSQ